MVILSTDFNLAQKMLSKGFDDGTEIIKRNKTFIPPEFFSFWIHKKLVLVSYIYKKNKIVILSKMHHTNIVGVVQNAIDTTTSFPLTAETTYLGKKRRCFMSPTKKCGI